MREKVIHIIIVNYNSFSDTVECLESLYNSRFQNFKVYIIDNDSEVNILDKLESWVGNLADSSIVNEDALSNSLPEDKTNLIKLNKNLGFSGANNIILKRLPKEENNYIYLLNPDIVLEENTLDYLIESSIYEKTICGTQTFSYSDKKFLHTGLCRVNKAIGTIKFINDSSLNDKADYVNGGSLFFPSSAIQDVGPFPEEYFLYWEESVWCKIALQKGYKLKSIEKTKVWDKGSQVIGKGLIAEYYYTRNGLYYCSKFHPIFLLPNLIAHCLRIFYRLIQFKFKRMNGIIQGMIDFLSNKKGQL